MSTQSKSTLKGLDITNTTAYLKVLIATMFWAGNFIVAQGLSDKVPSVGLAFWRWVIAVIFLLPFAYQSLIKEWSLVRANLTYLSITSFIGVTLFNTLIYFAGHTTKAINLSLIAITAPIFMIILSRIFLGEIITLRKGTGIIITITGVLVLITKGSLTTLLEISFVLGDLIMLLAASSFATYSILIKRKPTEMSTKTFLLSTFSLGVIFLLPFYLIEHSFYQPVVLSPLNLGSILYVGIFASTVAFYFWNQAITIVGPLRAAAIYYSMPLFSSIMAVIFLNESLTIIHIISMILIVTGIFMALTSTKK